MDEYPEMELLGPSLSLFLKRFYLFIFREGKGGRKRRKETSMCGCLSSAPPPHSGDLAHNPGMCPDWESNWWLWFSVQCSLHWATPARAFFVSCMAFVLKSVLSGVSSATLAFVPLCPFSWNIFFHPFIFSLCVSFSLKWVSCRQRISTGLCRWPCKGYVFLSIQSPYVFLLEHLIRLHLK